MKEIIYKQLKSLIKPSQVLTITKTFDTLNIVPIINDKRNAYEIVFVAVRKCAIGLGLDFSQEATEVLAEDLIDKYKYDSIEDILFALKSGRQGKYGNNYGKLNMIVISEWMAKNLEEKSKEREKLRHNEKKEEYELPQVNYEAYKVREKEEQEKEVKKRHSPEDVRKQAEEILKNGDKRNT